RASRARELRAMCLAELILYSKADDQIEEAAQSLPTLEKFVAADPDHVSCRLALAKCLMVEERVGEAGAGLGWGMQMNSRETKFPALLAEFHVRRSETAAAAEVLRAEAPAQRD